jgi:hypothetical protein
MIESPRIRQGPLRASLREGLNGLASLQADWMRLAGGALTTNREDNQRRFVEAMFRARESHCKPLIFRISVNGNSIAGLIALRYGRTLVAMKIGFLDAERCLGAGHLLLREVLRYSCDQAGIEWVDMVSDAAWLAPWKPEVQPYHWVYLPPGRPGADRDWPDADPALRGAGIFGWSNITASEQNVFSSGFCYTSIIPQFGADGRARNRLSVMEVTPWLAVALLRLAKQNSPPSWSADSSP